MMKVAIDRGGICLASRHQFKKVYFENLDLSFVSRKDGKRLGNRVDTDLAFHLNTTAPYIRYVYNSLGSLKSKLGDLPQLA
jgi:hypothetical protein